MKGFVIFDAGVPFLFDVFGRFLVLLCSESCVCVPGDGSYAIKKVLVQSEEQAEMVRQEIEVSTLFNHPNVLRLLDSDIIPLKVRFTLSLSLRSLCTVNSEDGRFIVCVCVQNDGTANKETLMNKEAYLLFPVYKEGTLQDQLTRMQNEKKFFPKITVLHIFQQVSNHQSSGSILKQKIACFIGGNCSCFEREVLVL